MLRLFSLTNKKLDRKIGAKKLSNVVSKKEAHLNRMLQQMEMMEKPAREEIHRLQQKHDQEILRFERSIEQKKILLSVCRETTDQFKQELCEIQAMDKCIKTLMGSIHDVLHGKIDANYPEILPSIHYVDSDFHQDGVNSDITAEKINQFFCEAKVLLKAYNIDLAFTKYTFYLKMHNLDLPDGLNRDERLFDEYQASIDERSVLKGEFLSMFLDKLSEAYGLEPKKRPKL